MKAKYALIALLAVTFFGCDDNTAGLGLGMFPGSDQGINGKLTTFDVTTKSIPTGEIYAKTNIGYVGKFTDNTFGTYEAGFLSTLNCPKGMTFPAVYTPSSDGKSATGTMVGEEGDDIYIVTEGDKVLGNIRAVELYLWYSSYFGDSLTACRLSVYELDKKKLALDDKNSVYYTNIKPEEYSSINSQSRLGTKAYTAVDLSIKDSIRHSDKYTPSVHLNLEKEIANRVGAAILKASRNAGPNFDNDIFSEVFKGIYVKSDYGDGTVLYIDQVQMNVVYKCYAVDDNGVKLKKTIKEEGDAEPKDSTYYTWRPFTSTREVIQANRLKNNEAAIDACIKQTEWTYLKSPAGIFTEATLPVEKIQEDLAGDTLNAVKLTFSNYNQSGDKKFGMSIPSTVMLIRKKYKDSFFEKNQLPDNISSFLTPHTNSTNQYTFSNITKLINDCVNEKEEAQKAFDKGNTVTIKVTKDDGTVENVTVKDMIEWMKMNTDWDKVILIPVLVTYDSSNNGYGNSNVISVQHDLKPGYVKLKGGKKGDASDPNNKYNLKLEVVSTSFFK